MDKENNKEELPSVKYKFINKIAIGLVFLTIINYILVAGSSPPNPYAFPFFCLLSLTIFTLGLSSLINKVMINPTNKKIMFSGKAAVIIGIIIMAISIILFLSVIVK